MFQQLDVKYFRQHEDKQIRFEPGVVALRGRNEAGKTTILEAMAYAMFGAAALREPLDDVVTWGRKTNELKVKLDFALNGVDYRITRSKSGAEIRNQDQVLATGQKEVTRYMETLLGASQEVCTKLMLASQDDIKGALSKGPSAAIELIEALSNLGVIDTIIGLAQDQLACGTTVAVTERVRMLEQQVEVPVEGVSDILKLDVETHERAVNAATTQRNEAKDAYDETTEAAQEAQVALDRYDELSGDAGNALVDLEHAKAALQRHVVPDQPDVSKLEGLRKQLGDSQYMARAEAAAEMLGKVPETENEWEGNYDSLVLEIARNDNVVATHWQRVTQASTQIARQEAQRITETACGLCGKDLSKVPEVVTKNAALDRQIAALREEEAEHRQQHHDAQQYGQQLRSIQNAHTSAMRVYQKCGEFIKLDEGFCPPRCEWTGPAELEAVDPAAIQREINTIEAADRAYHSAVAVKQRIAAQVSEAQAKYEVAQRAQDEAKAGVEVHQATLDRSAALLQTLQAAEVQLQGAQAGLQTARHALELAEVGVRARQDARKALEAQLAAARKELAEMDDNNALIRFLREARPVITDQLWDMVMSTVSVYFSDIRGSLSMVTREDNGFKVDGHNVAGLSGSTKDALGLAIRKALTKTFLPNASFMMLDEPAAACDDERETNMLGLIAAGGFEQVLLITHSDLADSFANQVVQL